MQELEKQVCNVKLAQRLRKLRVNVRSLWTWCKIGKKWRVEWSEGDEPLKAAQRAEAYTVSELGDMLPFSLDNKLLKIGKCADGSWLVFYEQFCGTNGTKMIEDQGADTEADARAKMVIYLAKNKFIAA
jgi:hypothetical protein